MEELFEPIGQLVVGLIIIALVALLLTLPTMWLWNYLMPDLFKLPQIGFWQGLCINLFSGILFRSSSSSKK